MDGFSLKAEAASDGPRDRQVTGKLHSQSRRSALMRMVISSTANASLLMAVAFCAAVLAAASVLITVGTGERGTDIALQVTGRLSFVLFWPAYAGGAAVSLLGASFEVLKRNGRNFGLAFASAHLVHIALVAWLYWLDRAPPLGSLILFGIAGVFTYLLAVSSFVDFYIVLGRGKWRVASTLMLNYIGFAFAFDFTRVPPQENLRYLIGYLPFVCLAVAGPLLRVGAWANRAHLGRVAPEQH